MLTDAQTPITVQDELEDLIAALNAERDRLSESVNVSRHLLKFAQRECTGLDSRVAKREITPEDAAILLQRLASYSNTLERDQQKLSEVQAQLADAHLRLSQLLRPVSPEAPKTDLADTDLGRVLDQGLLSGAKGAAPDRGPQSIDHAYRKRRRKALWEKLHLVSVLWFFFTPAFIYLLILAADHGFLPKSLPLEYLIGPYLVIAILGPHITKHIINGCE